MIVQEADHPLVVFRELEVCLPEAVAMFPLEPTLTPNPSRRLDRIVQSSLDEDLVDGGVADSALSVVVAQVSFDAAWSSVACSSQLEDEFRCLLWGSMDCVGSMGLDS